MALIVEILPHIMENKPPSYFSKYINVCRQYTSYVEKWIFCTGILTYLITFLVSGSSQVWFLISNANNV